MATIAEMSTCQECGCLVGDSRAHRRWHDIVVVTKSSMPRGFVGQDMPEPPPSYPTEAKE